MIQNFIFPSFVIISIVMVVVFSENVKKADKEKRFKRFYVCLPFSFSLLFAAMLLFGKWFPVQQLPFYWAVIFGVSVFGYSAIYKNFKAWLESRGNVRSYPPVVDTPEAKDLHTAVAEGSTAAEQAAGIKAETTASGDSGTSAASADATAL
jgi:hypothetical protein